MLNNVNKDNKMITLNDLYEKADEKTNEAWANITEDGTYNGRLAAAIMSEQSKEYVADGAEPKVLVSYVFDLLNEKGESVHVSTKPCTISFTDKSKLPQIWKVKSGAELKALLNDDNGNLKDLFVRCVVEVKETEKGFFPTVTKVSKIMDKTEQNATKLSDWDLKVYGRTPLEVYLTPDYEASKA